MAKSNNEFLIQQTGQLVTMEDGTQYFICGNNRIKISEHFAAEGRPLGDLIVDVIQHTADKGVSA